MSLVYFNLMRTNQVTSQIELSFNIEKFELTKDWTIKEILK